ncbi:MAG: hypothetical protein KR126chlam1_00049 [Chlamydiae bacterium]|nr:hypothetical protein [Chlamydiota bacterium]
MLLPSFLSSLAFGAISGYMAHQKGKNPYLWFFLGVLFGIFGLLFLLFGDRAMRPRQKSKKDETVIDITPTFDPEHKKFFWYYLGPQNTQNGPMSFDALTKAWTEGKVTKSTYVWNESLDNWKPFDEFIQTPN